MVIKIFSWLIFPPIGLWVKSKVIWKVIRIFSPAGAVLFSGPWSVGLFHLSLGWDPDSLFSIALTIVPFIKSFSPPQVWPLPILPSLSWWTRSQKSRIEHNQNKDKTEICFCIEVWAIKRKFIFSTFCAILVLHDMFWLVNWTMTIPRSSNVPLKNKEYHQRGR